MKNMFQFSSFLLDVVEGGKANLRIFLSTQRLAFPPPLLGGPIFVVFNCNFYLTRGPIIVIWQAKVANFRGRHPYSMLQADRSFLQSKKQKDF